jgi:8-oxo-dGTP pyrophosphatase MutT (NUDIX family)
MSHKEKVVVAIVTRMSLRRHWAEPRRVYLVSYRADPNKPLLGILQPPGGRWYGPKFESSKQAVRRELAEETGIIAPPDANFIRCPGSPFSDNILDPNIAFYPFFWEVTGHMPIARITEKTQQGYPKNTAWDWWNQHEISQCHFPSPVGVGLFMLSLDKFAYRLGMPV